MERNDANDGGETSHEYESPVEVYHRLLEMVSNEMESPELLPYEETVIDCMTDQIEHMNENMKRLENKLDPFCVEQHKIELERYGYAVNKYLRIRIDKIESQSSSLITIVQSNGKLASKLMSRQEIKYLDNYVSSIDNYMSSHVLGRLPYSRTPIMAFKMSDISADNKFDNCYVFVRALKDTHVVVDDGVNQEVLELSQRSQHFLPYGAVRRHLISGSRDLLLI